VSRAGGYTILKTLSQSARGRVYLARAQDGSRVALKELVFATVPDATVVDAFEREGRLLAQLKHPAIPGFREAFREGSGVHLRLYLAQDYIEGPSLLEALKTHRYSEAEGVSLAAQVLEILAYLEGLSPPVLHRDVKPSNLILQPDGRVALVDFGVARDAMAEASGNATLVGTFGYMPPEQLGGTLHPSADRYALGATLIHLLTREPPHRFLGGELELDFEGKVAVSPGTLRFLRTLTARRPEDRDRSARAALNALGKVGEEETTDAPTEAELRATGAALEAAAEHFEGLRRAERLKATGVGVVIGVAMIGMGLHQLVTATSDQAGILGVLFIPLSVVMGAAARYGILQSDAAKRRHLFQAADEAGVRATSLRDYMSGVLVRRRSKGKR
jgi:serine/threonine-protein kinase